MPIYIHRYMIYIHICIYLNYSDVGLQLFTSAVREARVSQYREGGGPLVPPLNPPVPYWFEGIPQFGPPDAERRRPSGRLYACYTQRNIFEILSNQTKIRLYLSFSDWFGIANRHCSFAVSNQSENGEWYMISVRFNKIPKIFLSMCVFKGILGWFLKPMKNLSKII